MEEEGNNLSADQIHALEAAEEAALLADEDPQDEAEAPQIDAEPKADDTPKPEAKQQDKPADTPAEGAATMPPAEAKPSGDTRAALRAARRSEQRAKGEVERLRAENEALRAKVPAEPSEDITDEDVATIEADFPVIAKAVKAMRTVAATVKPQAAAAQADPEFEPPTLPPELQEVVDQIPDLLGWQHDSDQTLFEMAKAEDRKLLLHPKWKDASEDKRLAEVVRRVKADIAEVTPEPTPQRANVKDAIARAPRVTPNTLADIGGGGDTPNTTSNLGRYSQMSNEDIEADLLRS